MVLMSVAWVLMNAAVAVSVVKQVRNTHELYVGLAMQAGLNAMLLVSQWLP